MIWLLGAVPNPNICVLVQYGSILIAALTLVFAGAVKNIAHRMKSKAESTFESTFAPSDILPADGQQPYPKRAESDFRPSYDDRRDEFFGVPYSQRPMSSGRSNSPPSVFQVNFANTIYLLHTVLSNSALQRNEY